MKITLIILLFSLINLASFAQELQPTDTEALVNITTVNSTGEAKPEEKVSFSNSEGRTWSVVTGVNGTAQLLVPKGTKYTISYITPGGKIEHSEVEIPNAVRKVQFDLLLEFEQPKVYTLKNVNFETGSAVVKRSSYPNLDQLAELMAIKKNMKIEIGGHTDDVGDPDRNLELSRKRAESVRSYLIGRGISGERITAVGYGHNNSIASNATPEGRMENRRTEVRILQE